MSWLHWLVPWEPSVTITLITTLIVTLYLRGSVLIALTLPCKLAFWTGCILLYTVCHTRFDYYAEHEFFVHRVQHTILHHSGPFLIVLSQPQALLKAGMPACMQGYIRRITDSKLVTLINSPVIAVLLFCGVIIFWLLPSIHVIAMLDWRLYRVMNWGMAINGLMFWGTVLNAQSRYSATCRMVMMLAIIPPQIAIGALIFLAPHELYPIYTICGRAFAGLSPLADQQLGGLILWVPAAMMSVLGVIIVARQVLTQQRR